MPKTEDQIAKEDRKLIRKLAKSRLVFGYVYSHANALSLVTHIVIVVVASVVNIATLSRLSSDEELDIPMRIFVTMLVVAFINSAVRIIQIAPTGIRRKSLADPSDEGVYSTSVDLEVFERNMSGERKKIIRELTSPQTTTEGSPTP